MRKNSLELENELKKLAFDELNYLLFNSSTSQIIAETLKKPKHGFAVILQILNAENIQYRTNPVTKHSKYPRIEEKLLAICGYNLTKAQNFLDRDVRTKEKVLNGGVKPARSVKVSETMELQIALDAYFNGRENIEKEIKILKASTLLYNELISKIPNLDKEILEKVAKQKEELEELVEKKKNLENELISEIVDIYYNLTHLMSLDKENMRLYEHWFLKLNQILGWTTTQAISLTIAKFHARIRNSGKNTSKEYEEIKNCLIQTGALFPTYEQLVELFEYAEQINSLQDENSIASHYSKLKREFPTTKSANFAKTEQALKQLEMQERGKRKLAGRKLTHFTRDYPPNI